MIEHDSWAAVGKSTDVTVSGLIHTYRVTNISIRAAGMVKPFDNTISVILCEKDIGRVRAGACNRKAIKCRHTCKFTGNIEAIRSVSGDGIRAIGPVSDGPFPLCAPKDCYHSNRTWQ